MTAKKLLLTGTILGAALIVADGAAAQTSTTKKTTTTTTTSRVSDTDLLRQQVQDLQRQLNELKVQSNANVVATTKAVEEVKKASATDVKVTLPNGRPTFTTNDGNFSFALTGRVHFDVASYFEKGKGGVAGPDLNSGVNARRIFFGATGKIARDWEYVVNFNAGGSGNDGPTNIQEARLTYAGIKGWKFDIGYLDPNNNLSEATGSNDIEFIERAGVANAIDAIAASETRAAVGFRTNGDQYFASGYLTGTTGSNANSAGTSGDEQIGIVGRVAVTPYKTADAVVHIGVNGQYVLQPGQTNGGGIVRAPTGFADRPELRVDGRSFINAASGANTNIVGGALNIDNAYQYGFELAGSYKGFYAEGQYARFGYDTKNVRLTGGTGPVSPSAEFDGYYVQAMYIFTGETRPYNIGSGSFGGVKPLNPLQAGGPGAWEAGVRYSVLNLNDTNGGLVVRGGKQELVTFGVNWYPNNNVRFMLNYITGDVERRNVVTNLPVAQNFFNYNAIAFRTQFAF